MAWQCISDVAKELTRHSINFYNHVRAGLCSHKINKFDWGGEGRGTVQGSVNVNLQLRFHDPLLDFSSLPSFFTSCHAIALCLADPRRYYGEGGI